MTFRAIAGSNKYFAEESDRPLPTDADANDIQDGAQVTFTDSKIVELFDAKNAVWINHPGDAVSNIHFAQSSYSNPTMPTSTTVASENTPTGATQMELGNFSTTPGEWIAYAFGIDAADAENNLLTGGSVLFATGDKLASPISIPLAARDNGGFAFKSATGTPNMYRAYGS